MSKISGDSIHFTTSFNHFSVYTTLSGHILDTVSNIPTLALPTKQGIQTLLTTIDVPWEWEWEWDLCKLPHS